MNDTGEVRAAMPPVARAQRGPLARLLRCSAGVSAVEFALLAPVLVLGAFSSADAGRAIYERMMIGQALRSGAQAALAGASQDEIHAVVEEVASGYFEIAGPDAEEGALSIDVSEYCACPGGAFVEIGCASVCVSGEFPTRFHRLSASKTFDGVMLPDFGLSGSMDLVAQ